jgi:putative ABC transport system permease protein
MIFWETLRLAFASLRTNTLRSALTVFGMAVGVFSIIGVMTFLSGAQAQLESGLSRLGTNSFQIQKFPGINFSNPRLRFGNRRDITLPVAQRFREIMGAAARVNLQLRRGNLVASHEERRTNPSTRLIGTDDNFLAAASMEIALGRNLGPDDVALGRFVAIIGDEIAKKLFPDESPLGRAVRIGGQNYTVLGVVAAKGASFGESQDDFVAIPISRWLSTQTGVGRSISINVQAPSQAEFASVFDQAIGAMRLVRGLEPEDGDDFEMFTNDSLIETFNNIMRLVAMASFGISAVALFAAGIGVMNIMLVSVTERTKEIGVRKSVGARKAYILAQFLVEAATLALAGGLLGVVLGVAAGNGIAAVMNIDVIFPWGWAVGGLSVCGLIGVVFGLYPAWKAAALDPIEALRHE